MGLCLFIYFYIRAVPVAVSDGECGGGWSGLMVVFCASWSCFFSLSRSTAAGYKIKLRSVGF